MKLTGFPRNFMELYGIAAEFHGLSENSTDTHKSPRNSIEFLRINEVHGFEFHGIREIQGIPWSSIECQGIAYSSMEFYGIASITRNRTAEKRT